MPLSFEQINDSYMDILKELGNIGAGNAATSLSEILNRRIDMSVPKARIVGFNELERIIGPEDFLVAATYLEFTGDIQGTIMFVLSRDSAKNLLLLLMGYEVSSEEGDVFSEFEVSALQEVGNILAGAYLGAVSRFTKLTMKLSVPSFAFDMIGAVLSVPLIEFGYLSDKALFIETDFINGCDSIKGDFLVIPDMESYSTVLKSLGVI
jgi:chemotaxis protein CheC